MYYISVGLSGEPGKPGLPGTPGVKGTKGDIGLKGECGSMGPPGRHGEQGLMVRILGLKNGDFCYFRLKYEEFYLSEMR